MNGGGNDRKNNAAQGERAARCGSLACSAQRKSINQNKIHGRGRQPASACP